MKKIGIVLICLLLLMASCNQPSKSNVSQTSSASFTTEEKRAETYPPEPPHKLLFRTFDEIQEFINAVKSSEQDFENYQSENLHKTVFMDLSYKEAQTAVENLSSIAFPSFLQGLERQFALTYSVNYYRNDDCLSANYTVEGIRYCFDYYFDCSSEKEAVYQKAYDEKLAIEPVLFDVVIGEDMVNLYEGEDGFYSVYKSGSTWVMMHIDTTKPELIKLDSFEFSKLFQQEKVPPQAPPVGAAGDKLP